jgi:hypothetical protein
MQQHFECHITIDAPAQDRAKVMDEVSSIGWKFSAIDGDPLLGAGTKMYATRHYGGDQGSVIENTQAAAEHFRQRGLKVIREKVELIVWDSGAIVA